MSDDVKTSDEIASFLNAMFAGGKSRYLEIRLIRSAAQVKAHGKYRPLRHFFASVDGLIGNLPKILSRAEKDNLDVYFGVGTRWKKSGKKDAVVSLPALWVDLDFKLVGEETARKLLETDLPARTLSPSVTVFTGHGYHLYWLLDSPLDVISVDDCAGAEDLLKRLEILCGGDCVANVDRILRLPGSINRKVPGEAIACEIQEMDLGRRYTVDRFRELPDVQKADYPDPQATAPETGALASAGLPPDTGSEPPDSCQPSPSSLSDDEINLIRLHPKLHALWTQEPRDFSGGRSARDFAFAYSCAECRIRPSKAARLLWAMPNNKGREEGRAEYVQKTIEKAYTRWTTEIPGRSGAGNIGQPGGHTRARGAHGHFLPPAAFTQHTPLAINVTDHGTLATTDYNRPRALWGDDSAILIAQGSQGALHGREESRKSWLATALAYHIAMEGESEFLGYPVTPDPVPTLILSYEMMPYYLKERLDLIRGDLPPAPDLHLVTESDLAGKGFDLLDLATVSWLSSTVERLGVKFVVIDPVAQSWTGDESNKDWARLLNNLALVRKDTDTTILLIHHERKSGIAGGEHGERANKDSFRGGTGLRAGMRFVFRADYKEQHDLLEFSFTKNNYGVKPFTSLWLDVDEPWEPQVVEKPVSPKQGKTSKRDAVMEIVREAGAEGVLISDIINHPGCPPVKQRTVQRYLTELIRAEMVEVSGQNRTSIYRDIGNPVAVMSCKSETPCK